MSKSLQKNQKQKMALMNLQEISQGQWANDIEPSQINTDRSEKIGQSLQLLNPIQRFRQAESGQSRYVQFLRPNTIQCRESISSHSQKISEAYQKNKRYQNLQYKRYQNIQNKTSFNFYTHDLNNTGQDLSFNTFEQRSKIKSQIDGFVEELQQKNTFNNKSTDKKNHKQGVKACWRLKNRNKQNSLLYNQVKKFLVSSFQVAGKPVSIRKDGYAVQNHGLPSKKSIYSFKNKEDSFYSKNNIKNQHLKMIEKVKKYRIEQDSSQNLKKRVQNHHKIETFSNQNISKSLSRRKGLSKTLELRSNQEIKEKKVSKGKLWLGRPPIQVVAQAS